MRTIREVLRLKLDCGLSDRQIAKSTGLARSTIGEYLRRFHESGLLWPLSQFAFFTLIGFQISDVLYLSVIFFVIPYIIISALILNILIGNAQLVR